MIKLYFITGGADTVSALTSTPTTLIFNFRKTVSALSTFILAMVLNPEVQRKAQEEVDNVVGRNSLPTFADLPKLKYVDAIRKECLR